MGIAGAFHRTLEVPSHTIRAQYIRPDAANSSRHFTSQAPADNGDYVGQKPIIGPGWVLRRSIEADPLSSLILYGPPDTGKTTLASLIANTSSSALKHRSCTVDFEE